MNEKSGQLCRVLREELELFDRFHALYEKLRNGLILKDWEKSRGLMEEISFRGERINACETEREELVSALREARGLPEETSFPDLLSYEDDARVKEELHELFTALKIAVFKVKAQARITGNFIQSHSLLLGSIMEQLGRDKEKRFYGKSGAWKQEESSSVFFNMRR